MHVYIVSYDAVLLYLSYFGKAKHIWPLTYLHK